MKKLFGISFAFVLMLILSAAASAASVDTVTVYLRLLPTGIILDNTATLELYASDGATLIDTAEFTVDRYTENTVVEFSTPGYEAGECFQLRLAGGLKNLDYNWRIAPVGDVVFLQSEETADGAVIDDFWMDAVPYCEKKVNIFVDGEPVPLDPGARLINGTTMVPVIGMADAIGVVNNTYWEDTQSVEVSIGDYKEVFTVGYPAIVHNGTEYTMPQNTMILDAGAIFVPLRDMAEGFGCEITVYTPDDDTYDINVSYSPIAREVEEAARIAALIASQGETANTVNRRGIASQTDYLIWISKSEYLVRVYQGSKGEWVLINSFPCAIGKPSTPTCTGEYRYYSRETAWRYSNYYCGPIMRFNGGYAIHSTLLRYDGTDYDGRVGVAISHGCVRLRPDKLDWLINTVPLYTKIYITN